MKKFLLSAILLCSGIVFAQPSSQRVTAQLTAACTNATTTCDTTAGSQLKVPVGEYTLGTVTVTGTFTGATLFFEFSDDGGVDWYPSACARNDSSIQELSEAIPNSTNRSWDCGLASGNPSFFRVRLSAISTGTINAAISLSSAQIEPAATVGLALANTQFTVVSNPAAGSQATASQAAAGANIKNVATMACFSGAASTAPVATALTINLRNGATGAGTVLATWQVVITASTGTLVQPFCVNLPNVMGSANTAMTLEYSAGLGNLIESVSLIGYTTP